ncbi:carbamoyltransferase family protein [Azospirillum canadense]|uniref:carbamoyltransferase family protein n=1 Tax=Azospirillum canadense TaxID=403962 RepID=UPI002227763E|nr:carbamoyltransferase C-terminal domain-containing protein [Azospirillum canadense]MCW2240992.1 carbamoyltransferase [Azospirillum canadense]
MHVLGVSYGFHDAAAAIISDGQVVAAAQQERFSRVKNDAGFPAEAIDFCLSSAGITADALSLVAYYEEPLVKFDRIVQASINNFPASSQYLDEAVTRWIQGGRFQVRERLAKHLSIPLDRIMTTPHHASHAASAFFPSPFDQAAVVTLDGVGEYETASISWGSGTRLERKRSIDLPHSIGLFYSAFTAFLGFTVNEGEYKVMGMAAFGRPIWKDKLLELFTFHPDGRFSLDQDWFEFAVPEKHPYRNGLVQTFGSPRVPGAPFSVSLNHMPSSVPEVAQPELLEQSQRYADLAASVQAVTEEVIRHVVTSAVREMGTDRVCMAGGVALNSLANGRLLRDDGLSLYVQPAAGDAGGSLGAAAYHWHHTLNGPRMSSVNTAALGPRYGRHAVDHALARSGFDILLATEDDDLFLNNVAELIAAGHVVGWFDGRSEWGPRSLGQRSILADPRRSDMQRIVNEKVKFREPFRPFAPAIHGDRVAEFFEFPGSVDQSRPENFMLAVHPVRREWASRLPAITHVDGTARVQIVHHRHSPRFYSLLSAVERRTGVPILLNTSFNLNGEPIVESPADAVKTFATSGLDYLCIENRILSKALQL